MCNSPYIANSLAVGECPWESAIVPGKEDQRKPYCQGWRWEVPYRGRRTWIWKEFSRKILKGWNRKDIPWRGSSKLKGKKENEKFGKMKIEINMEVGERCGPDGLVSSAKESRL